MPKNLQLELLEHFPIRDFASGLNELSGLALNRSGSKLYTVSDDTKIIFNLDLQGKIIANPSFLVELKDLEGLTVTANDNKIIAVQESSNLVVNSDIANRKEIRRTPLSAMKNNDQIINHFRNDDRNKGLEGITINFNNDHIFIVKEGKQGLLIELDSERKTILNYCELNEEYGFKHPRIKSKKPDFSGLSYYYSRDTIWIASDKGECIFQFDWNQQRVLNCLDLPHHSHSPLERVRKSEGIAFDPLNQRLYLVSDLDCELYI